jgi:flavin reductase (DIM6/NTAB) family NADH-FMN oxidoreductase RutF
MESPIPVPLTAKDVLGLLPPYPIVLVTVRDNIITVNQVQYFTFSPLRMGVAIAHVRYTYGLLKADGAFVINVPSADLVEAVKLCGSVSGRDVDKFELAGLTRGSSSEVSAASIAECGAQIECRVEREIEFEHRTWFVGPVLAARRLPDHLGMNALMCGREAYVLPGNALVPR